MNDVKMTRGHHMFFTDKPDDIETTLEAKIRKVRRRTRPVLDLTAREAAQAVRWAQPR
jgi:hypothetical protein